MSELVPIAAACSVIPPPVRCFDVLPARSWKELVQDAETRLIEPAYALDKQDDAYVFKALIPGVGPGDVHVELDDTLLKVRGTTEMRFSNGSTFRYVRRRSVHETFSLPEDVAPDAATCMFRQGVLIVTIPRRAAYSRQVSLEESATSASNPASAMRSIDQPSKCASLP